MAIKGVSKAGPFMRVKLDPAVRRIHDYCPYRLIDGGQAVTVPNQRW